jgi:hypothetical protein
MALEAIRNFFILQSPGWDRPVWRVLLTMPFYRGVPERSLKRAFIFRSPTNFLKKFLGRGDETGIARDYPTQAERSLNGGFSGRSIEAA